jgi:hypothetical protein
MHFTWDRQCCCGMFVSMVVVVVCLWKLEGLGCRLNNEDIVAVQEDWVQEDWDETL